MPFIPDDVAKKVAFDCMQEAGVEITPTEIQNEIEYIIDSFNLAFILLCRPKSREWIGEFIRKNAEDIFT